MTKKMHDSGKREEFSTGAVRDTAEDKPRMDLISPIAMYRLGNWLGIAAKPKDKGGKGYGDRNWEKGIPLSRLLAPLIRHAFQYLGGDRSEDHPAAMLCNSMFITHTEEMIKRGLLPKELDDLPNYIPSILANRVCSSCDRVYTDTGKPYCEDCGEDDESLVGIPAWMGGQNQAVFGIDLGADSDKSVEQVVEVPNKPTLMVTYSGKAFNSLAPDPELIDIEDIAHALSKQCRYTGHTKQFYSVAQHSVLASRWAKDNGCSVGVCLAILLHDASEAYLSDMSSPVKQVLPEYLKIEKVLQTVIYEKFLGGPNRVPDDILVSARLFSYKGLIKKYDRKMLALEVQHLMPVSPIFNPWLVGDAVLQPDELDKFSEPLKHTWSVHVSYLAFMSEFDSLMRIYHDPGNDQLTG